MLTHRIVKLSLIFGVLIFGFAAGWGLFGSAIGAFCFSLLLGATSAWAVAKFQVVVLEPAALSRGLKALSAVAATVAFLQLIRLTVFIISPTSTAYSTVPFSDWESRHSCLTAYYVADQSFKSTPDVYDSRLYSLPDDNPKMPRKPRMLGPFRTDVYEYPPPFLLLPHALVKLAPDFMRLRMLWYGFNGIVVLIAILMVSRALGPMIGTRALLLSPLLWASIPVLNTLQKGNAQILIIAITMIAMILLAQRRWIQGAAILAYAIASKIYPGMLVIYLLTKRRWQAVGWTTVFGVVLVLITLFLTGWPVFNAFFNHLPGILGGEAFPAFRNPNAVAINYSIPGIIFKLKLFGLTSMDFPASKAVGWIYTVIVITVVMRMARSGKGNVDNPLAWMIILALATLRSPFLPQAYAGIPALWLLTLTAAVQAPAGRTLAITILIWLSLNILVPMDIGLDPRWLAVITLIPQIVSTAIPVYALRFAAGPALNPEPTAVEALSAGD